VHRKINPGGFPPGVLGVPQPSAPLLLVVVLLGLLFLASWSWWLDAMVSLESIGLLVGG